MYWVTRADEALAEKASSARFIKNSTVYVFNERISAQDPSIYGWRGLDLCVRNPFTLADRDLAAANVNKTRCDEYEQVLLYGLLGMAAEKPTYERQIAEERYLVIHGLARLGDETAHDNRCAWIDRHRGLYLAHMEEWLLHRRFVVGHIVRCRSSQSGKSLLGSINFGLDDPLLQGIGQASAERLDRLRKPGEDIADTLEVLERTVAGERNPHAVVLPGGLVDNLGLELKFDQVAGVGEIRGDVEYDADFAHREVLRLDDCENRALARAGRRRRAGAGGQLDRVVLRVDVLGDDADDGAVA